MKGCLVLVVTLILSSCINPNLGKTFQRQDFGNIKSLSACLAACAEGTVAIQAFCRSVPVPAIRAACWAVQFAGPVVCDGFCYMYFGNSRKRTLHQTEIKQLIAMAKYDEFKNNLYTVEDIDDGVFY
uniref:Cnidarian restricted protein n=1 Tax=Clytia hemisphaerica TaxID=252671 RepID=A0A7M5WJ28_9CNID|eukprot:TCONS_00041573-protein